MSGKLKPWRLATLCLAVTLTVSCKRPLSTALQGYVEGEFVYVSAPLGGRILKLEVARGAQVEPGDPLFVLEDTAETAARDEAKHRLQQAQASFEDARKGMRPSEIDTVTALLEQAREAADLSAKELARQEALSKTRAVALENLDRARSANAQNRLKIEQLEATLKTAGLGLRDDLVAAAEAEVQARQAALAKAEWNLAQQHQAAPQAGRVDDTLYRPGEWVPAGRPVISLLPPANVKVRMFVPETRIATIHQGDPVTVRADGMDGPVTGHVSFISSQVEYTPPVIYSQKNRSKLVFMVELRFDDAVAATLHPGLPVDVELNP